VSPRLALRSERGLTLIELLVSMASALLVGAAAMAFLVATLNQSNQVSSRSTSSRRAASALNQLVRDLRQAMTPCTGSCTTTTAQAVTVSTTSNTFTVTFSIPTTNTTDTGDATAQNVTWTCSGTASSPGYCKRAIGSVTQIEAVGFETATFTGRYSDGTTKTSPATITNPDYLGISMQVSVQSQLDATQYTSNAPVKVIGSTPITVQAGVDLRNVS
jgi:Tfp pilus assembly protein PilW